MFPVNMFDKSLKVVTVPKHSDVPVKFATGLGFTTTCITIESEHPPVTCTASSTLYVPGPGNV